MVLLQVNVFKPATSKSGNSEQYVVCIEYKGQGVLTQKHLEELELAFCECILTVLSTLTVSSLTPPSQKAPVFARRASF